MDEFYAAVRGDYDYIMDTNLIETCKEAHGDLESSPPLRDGASDLVSLKTFCYRIISVCSDMLYIIKKN